MKRYKYFRLVKIHRNVFCNFFGLRMIVWLVALSSVGFKMERIVLNVLSTISNVAMAVCAIFAVYFAHGQIKASNQSAREIEAISAYRDYLSLAIDNEDFANGISEESERTPKYEWYVSYLLNSSEQIVESNPKSKEWELTLVSQLCLHLDYLESHQFEAQREHYTSGVQRLLKELPNRCG